MLCYSVRPTDRIFAEGYGLLNLAKNMGKYIGKILSG